LDHQISLSFHEGHFSAEFYVDGCTLPFSEITAVWSRVKPISLVSDAGSEQSLGQEFASKEWGYVLQSLPTLLSHARWINNPVAQQRMATKPYQLFLAQRVGLHIPATRITNNPQSAMQLFHENQEVAYKTLANFVFPPDQYIFTTRISPDALLHRGDAVRRAPGIFQNYVEKAYELRLTIVNQQVFTTKIHSQRFSKTQSDWRRSQLESEMYEPYEMPHEVLTRVQRFHRESGLTYGAYDFIVTPAGEYIFLECNPAGQWLWHEEQTGQPICAAMATTLMDSKNAT
jgi:glutathione synthase/RimK-type ligase-like ATP-grasp enzyme